MESIWNRTAEHKSRDPLKESKKVEVAVIGAGMAGVLTAYFLAQQGIEAVVYEAAEVGSGQTGHTTAKIASSHNLIYQKLIQDIGIEKARQYAHANQKAIKTYEQLVQQYDIQCDYNVCSSYLYSLIEEENLREEGKAAAKLGIHGEFTTSTELPFQVKGALKFEGQASFHPLQFLYAMADKVPIYEHTKILRVEGNRLLTEFGEIHAQNVVFTTHYPFINVPGYYFMRMHQERSYAMTVANVPPMEGMYLGVDKTNNFSFRGFEDQIILGGAGHRTGEHSVGGAYEILKKTAGKFWPESRVTGCWSAQDCMTIDGIPYIGKYSSVLNNWYVATGFGKWGMTTSMVAAMLISDMIAGKENPFHEVFSPQRFHLSASAKTLVEDSMKAAKGLIWENFKLPKESIEELPLSHGGIVEYEGMKSGVYKNDQGEVFIIDPRCPHMGCELKWNPDEKSWDCPCHGSRFDYQGKLLDNPAQQDLEHK